MGPISPGEEETTHRENNWTLVLHLPGIRVIPKSLSHPMKNQCTFTCINLAPTLMQRSLKHMAIQPVYRPNLNAGLQ